MYVYNGPPGYRGYGGYGNVDAETGRVLEDEGPSRAVWFLVGAATVLLWPVVVDVVSAGGRGAARRLER